MMAKTLFDQEFFLDGSDGENAGAFNSKLVHILFYLIEKSKLLATRLLARLYDWKQ
jgi:hypothetical protein